MIASCPSKKVIDGWPCISESLQWAEECPLYLMGQYTALQVGLLWYSKIGLNNNLCNYFTDSQTFCFSPHRLDLMQ